MVPARDPRICPLCGETREGGCHACPGPRVESSGDRAARTIDREGRLAGAEIVSLPGDDPWDAVRAMRHIRETRQLPETLGILEQES